MMRDVCDGAREDLQSPGSRPRLLCGREGNTYPLAGFVGDNIL